MQVWLAHTHLRLHDPLIAIGSTEFRSMDFTAPQRRAVIAIQRIQRGTDQRPHAETDPAGGAHRRHQVQAGEHAEAGGEIGERHPERAFEIGVRTAQHRSEEHTSELQSLMRISYAVFCLKKKTNENSVTKTQRKTKT